MVKNLTGGNKAKSQARNKSNNFTESQNKHVRKVTEEGEMYAIITKIFGGTQCQVMCNDGISRSCIIRGKFKARGKRDNIISLGTWILVGIREWEVRSSGVQKCDLLEVYSQTEKEQLLQNETCPFTSLLNANSSHKEEKEGGFIFSNHGHKTDLPDNLDDESGDDSLDKSSGSSDENEEDEKKNVDVPNRKKPLNNTIHHTSLKELMSVKNKTTKTNENENQNDWLKESIINVDDI